MSDIFREVDEEVRRSKAEEVWRRYGAVIVALCVLLVAGVGGYRYLEWQKEKATAAAGAQFEAALNLFQASKPAEGEAAMAKIATEGSGIYKALAQFRGASELAKRDPAAALKAFDGLATDQALDAGLRDVARLRAGVIAVDALPLADVERRLQPLIANNGAFRHHAHELLASAAVKAGDLAKARQSLDTIIIDRQAPAEIRTRAETLIGVTRGMK
jgi:hypothetical protein